jgi:hypothetical protein
MTGYLVLVIGVFLFYLFFAFKAAKQRREWEKQIQLLSDGISAMNQMTQFVNQRTGRLEAAAAFRQEVERHRSRIRENLEKIPPGQLGDEFTIHHEEVARELVALETLLCQCPEPVLVEPLKSYIRELYEFIGFSASDVAPKDSPAEIRRVN